MRDQIIKTYLNRVLSGSMEKLTVYSLCQEIPIPEAEFYQYFASLEQLEGDILGQAIQSAYNKIQTSPEWITYSAREKLLSFYYTLFEDLAGLRSFLVLRSRQPMDWHRMMRTAQKQALTAFRAILAEGISSGEIKTRGIPTDRYADTWWSALRTIMRFWLHDQSARFENTDAAIEKTVHATFDLMGRNFLDSFFDLGKFVWQQRFQSR
jgi:hypothetical protein